MTIKVKLIIKVIDRQNISVIAENNSLPQADLSNLCPDIGETLDQIRENYFIHNAYFEPKLVHFGTKECPTVYYSILLPKEFLNEKLFNKINHDLNAFSDDDAFAVRQALFVPAF